MVSRRPGFPGKCLWVVGVLLGEGAVFAFVRTKESVLEPKFVCPAGGQFNDW